jgi:polyhydroxyalkanoate synthase subunit PhaC
MFDIQATLLREQRRSVSRWLSWPRLAAQAREARAGSSSYDIVLEIGSLRLLRYQRTTAASHRTPVLFCYALVNRHYILDLLPDKSVIQRYLQQGFDVYLIDWGTPSDGERTLTLHDYVCGKLASVVGFIREAHGVERLHLVGYCMGGTMAALLAALEPHLVKTLTLLAAPIDFSSRQSLLNVWADQRHFDVDAFIDAFGNCPAPFLQACFLFTKPVENLLEKSFGLYEQMDDPRFVASYFALEHWINDNIPVAGETFREFVKHLYQRNELVRGELRLGDRCVELGRIECPLLLLTAQKDHLVPPASTEAIRERVSSTDIEAMTIEAGHVGLVVSSKAHKTLWPRAVSWLAQRA